MSPTTALILAVTLAAQPGSKALVSEQGEVAVAPAQSPVPLVPIAPVAAPTSGLPPPPRADVPRAAPDLEPHEQNATTADDVAVASLGCVGCAAGTVVAVAALAFLEAALIFGVHVGK